MRYELADYGRRRYDEESSTSQVVTHHELSRLAKRCGAATPNDLLVAVHNM
jgi:hypothetical protein